MYTLQIVGTLGQLTTDGFVFAGIGGEFGPINVPITQLKQPHLGGDSRSWVNYSPSGAKSRHRKVRVVSWSGCWLAASILREGNTPMA